MARPGNTPRTGAHDDEEAAELATMIAAARQRVQEVSLRETAREIGMTPTGLTGLLEGTRPYARTKARLRAWFAMRQGVGAMPPRAAENVIMAIVSGLPDTTAAALSLLEHAARLYTEAGVASPAWIARLRRTLAPRRPVEES